MFLHIVFLYKPLSFLHHSFSTFSLFFIDLSSTPVCLTNAKAFMNFQLVELLLCYHLIGITSNYYFKAHKEAVHLMDRCNCDRSTDSSARVSYRRSSCWNHTPASDSITRFPRCSFRQTYTERASGMYIPQQQHRIGLALA